MKRIMVLLVVVMIILLSLTVLNEVYFMDYGPSLKAFLSHVGRLFYIANLMPLFIFFQIRDNRPRRIPQLKS